VHRKALRLMQLGARTARNRRIPPTPIPLRLRLSLPWLRLTWGRAPRLCCPSQLMKSAPAQGTRCLRLALGALKPETTLRSVAPKKPRAQIRLCLGRPLTKRWSERAGRFGEATRMSMIWIKCLRLLQQRPRVAQRER
jgi:hypothetical protein